MSFLKPLRLWDGTGALCKGRAYAGGFENGELFSKYWQHMILTIWQVQGLSLESKGFENILDFIFNFSLWGGAAILGNTPWCGKLWRSGRKRSCCEVNVLKIKYNFPTIFLIYILSGTSVRAAPKKWGHASFKEPSWVTSTWRQWMKKIWRTWSCDNNFFFFINNTLNTIFLRQMTFLPFHSPLILWSFDKSRIQLFLIRDF